MTDREANYIKNAVVNDLKIPLRLGSGVSCIWLVIGCVEFPKPTRRGSYM